MAKNAVDKVKGFFRIGMLAFVLLMSRPFTGFAQQTDLCGLSNTSFKTGEKITYKVFYNMSMIWVAAGIANFTVYDEKLDGKDVFHIVGDGKTLKSYEWFYKVNDKYETWLDKETMLPLKFYRNVSEGDIQFNSIAKFDHNTQRIYTANKTFSAPKCIQDVLSTIYYARNVDYNKYKPGATIPFSMFLDDKVYNLYIKYLGKEKIKTKYGTFNTIKIKPLLISGTIFKDGDKMTVWVTDDANHIPVRVDSPILIGSIKVDLMSYSNLRSPMTALIKKK
ncbi:MAG TPA: DUF3108 domain-containing protein [Flavipsychrobacter sp.]|nr:DUF3108 domain-containing protein [Flavipsychrobacter sp.]